MTALVIMALSIPLSPNSVFSQEIFDAACGRAIIDGRVDPGEWSSASIKTFLMTQGILEATLRVMNSKNYLYLGITINDDEFTTYAETLPWGDGFRIDFDNDNSGSLYALGDDVLLINAGLPQFHDYHIYNTDVGSSRADTSAGGTSDGVGFSSRQGNLNHFELRHPICSGDTLDFCLSPGDTVGFRLRYLDAKADGTIGGSYFYPGSSNTSLAYIVIGSCTIDDFFIYLPLVNK
jgi:hypothetical protein